MKAYVESVNVGAEIAGRAYIYAKSTFVQAAPSKWIPAGLMAVVLDASKAFTQLFWIVIMLWASDLMIGFLRAWHDPKKDIEWIKVFRSVVKLFVIALAVVAMSTIEQFLLQTGLDTQGKLTVATLMVIGAADALSILANLSYFWPGLATVAERAKAMLGEAAKKQEENDAQGQ